MRALALIALLAAGPALAIPTPEAAARKALGDSRRDSGDNTGALAAYREAIKLSPDFVEAYEEVGKLYFEAKKYGDAAEAFQRAVDVDGTFANNWFNLALASRKAGDLARARDAFRRYLSVKPEDTETRLRLAEVLKQLGDREAAIKEYRSVVDAAEARTVAPALGEKAKEAIAQLRAEPPAPPPAAVSAPAASPMSAALPTAIVPAPTYQSQPSVQQQPVVQPAVAPQAQAPRPAFAPAAPPSPALLDKLSLGDRLQAAGDYRGALFAFQDAVYLDPRHAVARVKLGRAYWVLRYVGQADEQWLQAGQLAPNDQSIARMIEEARKTPRPAVAGSSEPSNGAAVGGPAIGATGQGTGQVQSAHGAGEPPNGPRVYKFVPETTPPAAAPPVGGTTPGYGMPSSAPTQGYPRPQPQGQPQYQTPEPQYAQPQPQYAQPQYAQPAPAYAQPGYPQPQYNQPAPAQPGYGQPAAPMVSASAGAAAQRYRAALSLYTQRDYLGAIAELDAAITLDPNLAVAYVARGSARFGLGKYRPAAADYQAALDLDPARAEPIWGLAECQRMLRDSAASDTYRRYAASVAGDVNEDRRVRARKWATELSPPQPTR